MGIQARRRRVARAEYAQEVGNEGEGCRASHLEVFQWNQSEEADAAEGGTVGRRRRPRPCRQSERGGRRPVACENVQSGRIDEGEGVDTAVELEHRIHWCHAESTGIELAEDPNPSGSVESE